MVRCFSLSLALALLLSIQHFFSTCLKIMFIPAANNRGITILYSLHSHGYAYVLVHKEKCERVYKCNDPIYTSGCRARARAHRESKREAGAREQTHKQKTHTRTLIYCTHAHAHAHPRVYSILSLYITIMIQTIISAECD